MMAAASRLQEDAAAVVAHPEFGLLKHKVIATTGLQYYADKDAVLADRIVQRQRTIGCSTLDYFRRALHTETKSELSALIDEITIGETYFFRYPEQFDALRQYLIPERVAQQRNDRTLRVWSAGCASGAEPYSLSIICQRDLTTLLRGWQVSVLGTDINHRALAQARTGEFSNWELRTMSEEMKRRCFRPSGKSWAILPEYRQNLHFEHQNLVADLDSFTRAHSRFFDIVLCRNVMIYFAPDVMRRVIQNCRECLASGGWLLVGHAEPYLEIANFLAPVSIAGITVYRKEDEASAAAMTSRRWLTASPPALSENETGLAFDGPIVADPESALPWTGAEPESLSSITPDPTDSLVPQRSPAVVPQVATIMSAEDHLAEIRRHVSAGDWTVALNACQLGIGQHALEPQLHYLHALVAEHLGSESAAERALGRAIYLDRRFALAHYHLGRCLAHRGDRSAAARSFRNALRTLAASDEHDTLPMGDGLTTGELREITELQLGLLRGPADDRGH
jgi:chemotaxis protein methyltransferase CheR